MNTKDFFYLLSILDPNDNNHIDFYYPAQEILENAKKQCSVWSIEDASKLLGRQFKSTVVTLYPLLCHIKKHLYHDVVYISQTDKKLLPCYNNNHSRIFHLIHNILIEKANVLYDLNLEFKAHSIAKCYYVCVENLNTMFKLYDQVNRTPAKDSQPLFIDGDGFEHKLLPVYYLHPSINSNLNIHEAYAFAEIKTVIFQRYPCIPYYTDLVDELNSTIVEPKEKIRFEVTAHYSPKGKITKLKIRAFSNTCLLKSFEKQQRKCKMLDIDFVTDPEIEYREQYLQKRFGEYEEYDVHASVPRVSRAMANNGDMGDLNEDLYRTIFEQFVDDYKLYFDSSITEWCAQTRDFFKNLFMRLFFGGTPKQILSKLLRAEQKARTKALKQGDDISNLSPYSSIIKQGVDLEALISKWQTKVYECCKRDKSKRHDTSVFLHESCIYLEVRRELAKRNIDVVQVYDGFYFKKGTMPSDMDEIIQASALKYFQSKKDFRIFAKRKELSDALSILTPRQYETLLSTPPKKASTEISEQDITERKVIFEKPR